MSVDMIMYRVKKLTGRDLTVLNNSHYYEIDSLCPEDGWEYKAYAKGDVEKNPERFAEIMKYMRSVPLRRTITDYKQCFIEHGMPADVAFHSYTSHAYEIILRWDGHEVEIPKTELEKYTHEETSEYYVVKYQDFDCDVSNYMARTLVNSIEAELGGNYCYRPCQLNKQMAQLLTRLILKEHDDDELYSIDAMMDFVMELMRALVEPHKSKDIFIEFQD